MVAFEFLAALARGDDAGVEQSVGAFALGAVEGLPGVGELELVLLCARLGVAVGADTVEDVGVVALQGRVAHDESRAVVDAQDGHGAHCRGRGDVDGLRLSAVQLCRQLVVLARLATQHGDAGEGVGPGDGGLQRRQRRNGGVVVEVSLILAVLVLRLALAGGRQYYRPCGCCQDTNDILLTHNNIFATPMTFSTLMAVNGPLIIR